MKDCGVKLCQAMPLLAWACPNADFMKGAGSMPCRAMSFLISGHVLIPVSWWLVVFCGVKSCQATSLLAWACPNAGFMEVLVLCHVVLCPA